MSNPGAGYRHTIESSTDHVGHVDPQVIAIAPLDESDMRLGVCPCPFRHQQRNENLVSGIVKWVQHDGPARERDCRARVGRCRDRGRPPERGTKRRYRPSSLSAEPVLELRRVARIDALQQHIADRSELVNRRPTFVEHQDVDHNRGTVQSGQPQPIVDIDKRCGGFEGSADLEDGPPTRGSRVIRLWPEKRRQLAAGDGRTDDHPAQQCPRLGGGERAAPAIERKRGFAQELDAKVHA